MIKGTFEAIKDLHTKGKKEQLYVVIDRKPPYVEFFTDETCEKEIIIQDNWVHSQLCDLIKIAFPKATINMMGDII